MILREVRGHTPKFGEDCFIAENATVVGEVEMGNHCSIWFNAVVRGDVHYIRIGNKVNIQDGAVIHALLKNHLPKLETMFRLVIMPLFMVVRFTTMF